MSIDYSNRFSTAEKHKSEFVQLAYFVRRFLFLLMICCLFLSSCQYTNRNYISNDLTLSNFINKTSIYLLGRKAYATEMKNAESFFAKEKFTTKGREKYLLLISESDEYKLYLFQLARNDLMNFIFNPDSTQIQNTIDVWTRMYPNDYGAKEIRRLKKLQTIQKDLLSGQLDNIGLHKRLVHNSYYDFINMGTDNFVVSMYNNFFDRPPTKYELQEGKKMVDNSDAVFLGMRGKSKEDFVALFFESFSYYEGQVRMLYKRYYFCEPAPEYLAELTLTYYKDRDLRKLQSKLLSADKFVSQ
jgi:hypothetical protein